MQKKSLKGHPKKIMLIILDLAHMQEEQWVLSRRFQVQGRGAAPPQRAVGGPDRPGVRQQTSQS